MRTENNTTDLKRTTEAERREIAIGLVMASPLEARIVRNVRSVIREAAYSGFYRYSLLNGRGEEIAYLHLPNNWLITKDPNYRGETLPD